MKKPAIIPMNRPITLKEWADGREARRATGLRVAPEIIRRTESSADKRLRAEFDGQRAP